MREALFEITRGSSVASYLHEKQTSRIQSLYLYLLYFIKIVPFWLRNIRILIQNTRSLFYGRHYSSLHRLMSLHRKLNVKIFLMFIVAENTGDKWKTTTHAAVNHYWNNILIEDCIGKSTVSRCGFASLGIGKQHIVWKTLDRNTHDVRRGAVKVRLLTGTYLVQSAVSKFNQYQVDPTCLLCRCSTEDYQHMILECSALLKYRENYLCEIKSIIDSECGPEYVE